MNTAAIVIQARIASQRLPKKIFAPLGNSTMLQQIVRRARAVDVANLETPVVVSVPHADEREVFEYTGIIAHAEVEDARDVLSRMLTAARCVSADHLVRVTADCPFVCPRMIEAMLNEAYLSNAHVVSNWIVRRFPDGFDLEVYDVAYLERLSERLTAISDREWFATWIVQHDTKQVRPVINGQDLSRLRLTVDYGEDLALCRKLYNAMGNEIWNAQTIVNYLLLYPGLRKMNAMHVTNFGARPECS